MPATETRRSIATVCLSGTLEDKLTAAAAAGFDGVEIFENDLVASHATPKQVRQQCAELNLSVDLYQPFRDFEAVPPGRFAANLRRAKLKFDVMEQLGADTVLVCSSVSPDAVDDDDLAAEQLHALAARAGELPAAGRHSAAGHGRAVMEQASSALSWAGGVRPDLVRRRRARGGVSGSAVARGVQRRPSGRRTRSARRSTRCGPCCRCRSGSVRWRCRMRPR
jgi:hypothetical protein